MVLELENFAKLTVRPDDPKTCDYGLECGVSESEQALYRRILWVQRCSGERFLDILAAAEGVWRQ